MTTNMVVQENNFTEIKEFVRLTESYLGKAVLLQILEPDFMFAYGTEAFENWKKKAVHEKDHPRHQELLDIIKDDWFEPFIQNSINDTYGETQINMDDPVVHGVINFLLGNSSDESIIPQFIEIYGVEAFQQLRRQVLNEVVPHAQTEGQIQGSDQGGMADDIGGMIGNKERVAVSQDEYIVPADVVSMLGDGSSDSGAAKLDTMLDRVRQAKTGRTTQAAPLKKDVLPA